MEPIGAVGTSEKKRSGELREQCQQPTELLWEIEGGGEIFWFFF